MKTIGKLIIALILFSEIISAQNYVTSIPNKFEVITLKDFLVSKPISDKFIPQGSSEAKYGYLVDFLTEIGGETSPTIVADKEFILPDGKKNIFSQKSWQTDYLDLTSFFGKPSDVFTYMYAELTSNKNKDVWLHIGSNDAAKVWFNSKLAVDNPIKTGRSAEPSQDITKVKVLKGKNTILLKIDQLGGGWGAYVQLYSSKAHQNFEKRTKEIMEVSNKNAEIIETKVICKETDRYIGWPSIVKTSTGELIAVFSGDRDLHVCPWGVTQLIRSRDNGKTWTSPITINNTPLDDRDAGIIETRNGTLVVSWFTSMAFDKESSYRTHPDWKRHRGKLNDEIVDKWLGNWIRRSVDGGETWEESVKVLCTSPHGPIELKDRRLMHVGIAYIDDGKKLGVEVSEDDGKTWQLLSTISIPNDENIAPYSEPHLAELPDGKLVAMFRYNPSDKSQAFLRQAESTDGGKTWSVTRKTNIWGYPPHLLLLNNGWLLTSYGVRRVPYSERACLSKDGGKTWDIDNEILLSVTDNGDLGYPASVQLDDGSIITIYYQIDKKGEKTSLMMTHWKLK